MAQALAAGVPQLTMPMGFDRPDNTTRLLRLGVARWVAPPSSPASVSRRCSIRCSPIQPSRPRAQNTRRSSRTARRCRAPASCSRTCSRSVRLQPDPHSVVVSGFSRTRTIMARMPPADYEKLGLFYLGKEFDLETGTRRNDLALYDSRDLLTHAVVVGMTGSGKTGLGITLIEEAAIDGIPVLAIDPKGDLGNLLLTFPNLAASDFAPWIDAGEAQRHNTTVDAYAARRRNVGRLVSQNGIRTAPASTAEGCGRRDRLYARQPHRNSTRDSGFARPSRHRAGRGVAIGHRDDRRELAWSGGTRRCAAA